MAIDYGDMFNRYAQARLDSATQPFTDPEAYLNKRMENQFGVTLDEQGNVKPRSTTITNNDDGSQTVTTKHEVTPMEQPAPVNYGFTAEPTVPTGLGVRMPQAYAQPMAPVAQPVAPAPVVAQPMPMPVVESAPMAQTQPVAEQPPTGSIPPGPLAPRPATMPTPMPVAQQPAMPVAPGPMNQAAVEQVNATQLPQPGPAIQVAGQMQMPPQPSTGQGLAVPAALEQHWSEKIAELGNNAPKLAAYYGNESNPEPARKVAADLYSGTLEKKQKEQQATKVIDDAISGDKVAVTQLTRDLASKKEDGSYVKAILLARLGLTDLAKEEQQKLGGSTTVAGVMGPDQKNYTVETSSNGEIRRAWDENGDRVEGRSLAALQAGAFASKGAVTGQTFGKAPIGGESHVISHTVLANGRGVIWKDETTGQTLSRAPIGYAPVGQQNPVTQAAIRTAAQVETKMRKANADASALGATAPFAEDTILQEKERILNGGVTTLAMGGEQVIPPTLNNAVQIASALGVPIISGARDQNKQQMLWDDSVQNGRTGFTAQGNPIARPGTSAHETANAVDIQTNQLTPEQRQKLTTAGLYQPIPQKDPNHWELRPTAGGGATQLVRQKSMAEKIANYELPPPSISQRNSAGGAALMNDILRLNPNYDGQKYKENTKIINDFSPGGTAGKSVVAMGTAASHIGDLRPLIDAVKNGDIQATNQFINNVKKWTGDPNVTNLEAVGPAVAAEIQKTFVSSGGGTGAERDELSKAFGSARSKEQLEGAVKMYENLMVGKLGELEKQYARTGRKDFWQNVVSDERLKDVYDRHNAERAVRENKPVAGQTKTGIKFKVVTE